jgi:hypothetical protein
MAPPIAIVSSIVLQSFFGILRKDSNLAATGTFGSEARSLVTECGPRVRVEKIEFVSGKPFASTPAGVAVARFWAEATRAAYTVRL